ncbi:hypothetical protein [Arthrobacter sp. HLT1-21]
MAAGPPSSFQRRRHRPTPSQPPANAVAAIGTLPTAVTEQLRSTGE